MKILCLGDVVSEAGIVAVEKHLRALKKETAADFVIVNGENAAPGNGIDKNSMERLLAAGADAVTGGNHSFQKKTAGAVLEEMERVLRPANLGDTFERGWCRLEGRQRDLLVINLQGMLSLPEIQNPFVYIDNLLAEIQTPRDITVVDFHAEATSEKQAMGYHLDGRVSLLFGTHTHVPTADEQILQNGTAYITDIGMCGPSYSILGKAVGPALHNFLCFGDATRRQQIEDAPAPCEICGIIVEINDSDRKAVSIRRKTLTNL